MRDEKKRFFFHLDLFILILFILSNSWIFSQQMFSFEMSVVVLDDLIVEKFHSFFDTFIIILWLSWILANVMSWSSFF